MKRAISIVLIIATMITLFAGLGIQSNAAENAVAKAKVDSICQTVGFRPFVDDYTDCYKYVSAFCNKMYGCAPGGVSRYSLTKPGNFHLVAQAVGTGVNSSVLASTLSKAKPGDVVQMYWKAGTNYSTQHTAIVYAADSNAFTVLQDGKSWSTIQKSTYSYSSNAYRWCGNGYGISVYRYNDYDTKFPVQPYFESTQVLQKTYDKIQVKFHVKNPIKTKITKFRAQIRKKGESSWHNFDKAISFTGGFYSTRTFAANAGCKYSVKDGTTYEIRGIASSSAKSYYSSVTQVTTPARINISNASLSGKSSVKFTGSNISVNSLVNVSYNGKKLVKGTDYTFSKDNVKNIGKHTITVTGVGKFKGTRKFTITVYPKTPTLNSLSYSRLTGRISLKWARVADCTKQQIAISTSSSFTNSKSGMFSVDQSKQSGSIYNYTVNGKKLHVERGKTYYIKMRAYKVVNGEKIYGKWGTVKSIKCK